jgi:hypothetical protein
MAGVFFLVQATMLDDADITYGVPVEADDWASAVAQAIESLGPGWRVADIDPARLARLEPTGDDPDAAPSLGGEGSCP